MPEPRLTGHGLVRLAQKGISFDAVNLICNAYTECEYDEVNDSYKLSGMVEDGHLEVCVTAQSFDRYRKVVKTAYWL